jgi:predicted enzyme related to lactoylglutathione lyase
MSERDHYPPGVPCWVDTGQPEVDAALDFYATVFDWEFAGPGEMPGQPPGRYYVARVGGKDVAGVSTQPPETPTVWNTYVSVGSVDDAARSATDHGGSVLVAPFDVSPAGRMAVLADPTGAVICAWEPGDRQGAQRINEPSAWAMSQLASSDPAAAGAFYAAVFGWESEPLAMGDTTMWLFRLPGYVGGEPEQPVPRDSVAVMTEAQPGTPPHWSVGFWIDDTDAAVQRAIDHGGTALAEPFDVPMFRTAVLQDPQGATFTISQLMLGD